jgi:hypothetical protein
MRARLKTEVQDVWQFVEPCVGFPQWVYRCVEWHNRE